MYGLVYRCAHCRIYFDQSLGKYGCPNACGGRAARLVQGKPGHVLHGAPKPQLKASSNV